MAKTGISRRAWTEDELILAFDLYCRLPFGKLHQRNPEIVALAVAINRSAGSVAMKLVNFASLDPVIVESGRVGLLNASRGDKRVWDAFHSDWNALERRAYALKKSMGPVDDHFGRELETNFLGKTVERTVQARVGQQFFRRAVLSSYNTRCCISGVAIPSLLVASHIVPWAEDPKNRLNPQNGLCLSVWHDRAFDQGLLTVSSDMIVEVAPSIRRSKLDDYTRENLANLHGKPVRRPERFLPNEEFLHWHRKHRWGKQL